jgi:hypothetical protein
MSKYRLDFRNVSYFWASCSSAHAVNLKVMQEEEEGRRRKKGERKRGKSQQTLSTSEIPVVDNN